ncbi:MAG: sigma-70 family RNA polymerase sigma factor [Clostridia bacterium]|nr:sigma-70 family RNA polymerase sigma factor [Clostridia bacterium]
MDRQELDTKISDVAKSILSYCIARTSNHFEAEDLAQDIILELYKSADNIRNTDAFYGFMWAVAGNVYKQWCKNKSKNKECELTDNLIDVAETFDNDNSELYLLRRELTLLSEKYRKAVILYYIENMSCSEISKHLSISESMVKYLLFKSRQILKEGINMERNYGKQSYNPKELSILYWGNGKNTYNSMLDNKISQNILFACYNDKLTAEEISLELGISLPYIEDILYKLVEGDVLGLEGKKYYTNIVIFTKDCAVEVTNKTRVFRSNISDILSEIIKNRNLSNSEAWLTVCCVLYKALFENLQSKIRIELPKNKFGENCIVWAVEKTVDSMRNKGFEFGVSNTENENGDKVQFFDFSVNGDMVHHSFYTSKSLTNIFIDIAKGRNDFENEFEKIIVAELVKKGYVLNDGGKLTVNVPVFTKEEFEHFMSQFNSVVEIIEGNANKIMNEAVKIIKNYIPVHLKSQAYQMAYFRIFEDAISMPVGTLAENKILFPYNGNGVLPTTYIVLK